MKRKRGWYFRVVCQDTDCGCTDDMDAEGPYSTKEDAEEAGDKFDHPLQAQEPFFVDGEL